MLNVFAAFHRGKHDSAFLLQEFIGVAVVQNRRIVGGVGELHLSGRDVYAAKPASYEEPLLVLRAKLVVDAFANFAWLVFLRGLVAYERLGYYHEHGGGNALSADVAHNKPKHVFARPEKVVKVAANFLGGNHAGVKLNAVMVGIRRKVFGQHSRLDAAGNRKLRADALLFACDSHQVFDVNLDVDTHFFYGAGKGFNFVVGVDALEFVGKVGVVAGKALGFFCDADDWAHKFFADKGSKANEEQERNYRGVEQVNADVIF